MTKEKPRYIDSPANMIAAALAKYFGGTHVPITPDGEYFEGWADVEVPAQAPMPAYRLTVSLRGYGAAQNHATVSVHPATLDNRVNTRGIELPSAGMDSTRPMQAICAAVSRRVVNAPETLPRLIEYAARVAEIKQREQGLRQMVANLLHEIPSIGLSSNYPVTDYEARLFSQGGGTYFNARMSAEGSVTFDRIGSVSLDQAKRIFAILAEKES